MSISLINKFKQGDLVITICQPYIKGIIEVAYDGKYEPEAVIVAPDNFGKDHQGGKVIIGLRSIRKLPQEKQEIKADYWTGDSLK